MKVSENFTREELECPCCHQYMIHEDALAMLQEMRNLDGKPFRINSAYRCVKHNKEVGGAPKSKHREGIAFDIALDGRDIEYMVELAEQVGFKGIGRYNTFIHVDARSRKARW